MRQFFQRVDSIIKSPTKDACLYLGEKYRVSVYIGYLQSLLATFCKYYLPVNFRDHLEFLHKNEKKTQLSQ